MSSLVHGRKKITLAQAQGEAFQSRSLAGERRHEIQRDTKLIQGEDQWVEALSEILRVGSKLEWGRPPGTEMLVLISVNGQRVPSNLASFSFPVQNPKLGQGSSTVTRNFVREEEECPKTPMLSVGQQPTAALVSFFTTRTDLTELSCLEGIIGSQSIMPQLDKFTYFTQFFWSCLFLFTFYIAICNNGDGVLGISRILKLRNQLVSHRETNIRSNDPKSLEDILRKDPSPWPISGSLGALATTVGGTLFLIICGIRQYLGHLTKEHHVGFEAAACGEPIDHSGPSNAGPSNVAPTDSPRGSFPSVPSSLTPIPSDPSSQRTYAMLSRFRRSRNVPRHLLVRGILFDGFDASGSLRMPENNDSFAIPDFIPSQEQVMGLGTILVDPFRASNQTSTRPFSEQSCWKGKQAIEEWETQKVVAGSSTHLEVQDELLLLNIPIELPNQYGRLSPAIGCPLVSEPKEKKTSLIHLYLLPTLANSKRVLDHHPSVDSTRNRPSVKWRTKQKYEDTREGRRSINTWYSPMGSGAKMSKTQKEFKGKDTKRRPQAKEIPKVHDAKSKGVACPPLVETSRLRTVLRAVCGKPELDSRLSYNIFYVIKEKGRHIRPCFKASLASPMAIWIKELGSWLGSAVRDISFWFERVLLFLSQSTLSPKAKLVGYLVPLLKGMICERELLVRASDSQAMRRPLFILAVSLLVPKSDLGEEVYVRSLAIISLRGLGNESLIEETGFTAFTATAIGFSSTMAFPVVLGVTKTRTPVTAYAGYRLRLYSSFVRDHSPIAKASLYAAPGTAEESGVYDSGRRGIFIAQLEWIILLFFSYFRY
ncbi:UNVERIFIED_CONTAM: putative ATP synthase protein YMF19 [Sesamum calycinum]|uniref:H(+)-transporting two-sector ATPase n=1 Tax=Sesamum calycinum TaxID=2727403 RepID=A0AAW2KFN1_9LAMI